MHRAKVPNTAHDVKRGRGKKQQQGQTMTENPHEHHWARAPGYSSPTVFVQNVRESGHIAPCVTLCYIALSLLPETFETRISAYFL